MTKFLSFLFFAFFAACNTLSEESSATNQNIGHYEFPFQDPSLTFGERIEDLISRLNIEEKTSLMLYNSPAIERLGIPEYNWWNECLHGVGRAGKATVFPQAIAMAATFDPDLIFEVATAISDEARAKHHAAVRKGNQGTIYGIIVLDSKH